MSARFPSLVLLVALALTPLGCRPHPRPQAQAAATSRVEHFKEKQAATVLTHGKICLESVEEAADGRIAYQTTDGKTWRVAMTPDERGGYRYGTPEEVK